jgi:hypothetical protein
MYRCEAHGKHTFAALLLLQRAPAVVYPCGEVVAWPLHLLQRWLNVLHAGEPAAASQRPQLPAWRHLALALQPQVSWQVQELLGAVVGCGAVAALLAAPQLLQLLAWRCGAWPGEPQAWWAA